MDRRHAAWGYGWKAAVAVTGPSSLLAGLDTDRLPPWAVSQVEANGLKYCRFAACMIRAGLPAVYLERDPVIKRSETIHRRVGDSLPSVADS